MEEVSIDVKHGVKVIMMMWVKRVKRFVVVLVPLVEPLRVSVWFVLVVSLSVSNESF